MSFPYTLITLVFLAMVPVTMIVPVVKDIVKDRLLGSNLDVAFFTSIPMLGSFLFAPVAGIISDRFQNRRYFIATFCFLDAFLFYLLTQVQNMNLFLLIRFLEGAAHIFIIGLLLLDYLGFKWALLPLSGWGTFGQTVLPTLALAIPVFAQVTRFFRSEMIETLNTDYIQLARAKGLTMRQVTNRHAYRNSMIPVLTLVGPMAANILTGSALIEQIFSMPGIGQQFVTSIPTKDYPVIMGTTIVYAMMLMVAILITDIIISIVDPRVRLA